VFRTKAPRETAGLFVCSTSFSIVIAGLAPCLVTRGLDPRVHAEAITLFYKMGENRCARFERAPCGGLHSENSFATTSSARSDAIILATFCHRSLVGERNMQAYLRRQHFLNFLPLPQGQGSLRPTSRNGLWVGWVVKPSAAQARRSSSLISSASDAFQR